MVSAVLPSKRLARMPVLSRRRCLRIFLCGFSKKERALRPFSGKKARDDGFIQKPRLKTRGLGGGLPENPRQLAGRLPGKPADGNSLEPLYT